MGKKFSRREILKGIAGLPVVGGLWGAAWQKDSYNKQQKSQIDSILNIKSVPPPRAGSMKGDVIRLGIIGPGGRGQSLMRAAGYATPDWLENARKNMDNPWFQAFFEQEDLNVRFTAVCDVFDINADVAYGAAKTDDNAPKKYRRYQDLLSDPNVDAVIIATPDHWHAPIAIDALKAGKHVYVEKCMTHKISETFELEEVALSNKNTVFAVGHQHRQTESFLTAQDIIEKNILGHVNLVQASTNRNSDNGAWQYKIHPKASPQTIDWEQFLGNAPKIPFNAEHFFRWRKWWPYGTGLAGDLLTHDYDRINCVMKMGIPASVMASGGVYTHKDGRDVPDVWQVSMEFPDYYRDSSQPKEKVGGMTFLYSATLGNNHYRPTVLMGHDASMELGSRLTVYADRDSTRYKSYLDDGTIKPGEAIYSYQPGGRNIDGVTSATSKYFADKGLLYTYRGGKKVDSTHLHVREWLSCIRHGGEPSCGIKEGFEEAISAHMSTLSYKTGKQVFWDKIDRKIRVEGMELSRSEMDEIIMRPAKSSQMQRIS